MHPRSGAGVVLLAALLDMIASAPLYASRFQAQIVNGVESHEFAAVGILLDASDGSLGLCSGTLIGCQTFVTAAHCVCPELADTTRQCFELGMAKPADLAVFFQHAGVFAVQSVTISPAYSFGMRGDVAVLALAQPVTGILPARLATASPEAGSSGTIVGFGRTDAPAAPADEGVKRAGKVITSMCRVVSNQSHVCWKFSSPLGPPGEDANTCQGDSGGPLFVDSGVGPLLAGLTSGGTQPSCGVSDSAESYDTSIAANLAFIRAQSGSDLGVACEGLPYVGEAGVQVAGFDDRFDGSSAERRFQFTVVPGTRLLRVALNAELGVGRSLNDFALLVKAGGAPDESNADCAAEHLLPIGLCKVDAPAPGTWHVLVIDRDGAGPFQVTATTFGGAAASCSGDCDGSGDVTIDELLVQVNVALGAALPSACVAGDRNGDGEITIDEIVQAVSNALGSCA